MHNTALAEWTLARFTSKPHAAAILGDLEETSATKGNAWFWRSYLRILLACAWRPLVAYIVVVLSFGYLGRALTFIFEWSARPHAATSGQKDWLGGGLALFVSLLSELTLYALIRFGLRETFTRLAFGFSVVGAGILALWWQPELLASLLIVGCILLLQCFFSSGGRRAMTCLSIVALLQPVVIMLVGYLMSSAMHAGIEISMAQFVFINRLVLYLLMFVVSLVLGHFHTSLHARPNIART